MPKIKNTGDIRCWQRRTRTLIVAITLENSLAVSTNA